MNYPLNIDISGAFFVVYTPILFLSLYVSWNMLTYLYEVKYAY